MEQIKNVASHAPFMEHRWGQRMPCGARVRIAAAAGVQGAGRVRDISSSGAFIETMLRIATHSRIALTVTGNASARRPVDIEAIVVRADEDGVGVEWCDTPSMAICNVVGCASRCNARG